MEFDAQLIQNLLLVALFLPLVSFLVLIFFGREMPGKVSGWLGTAIMGAGFVCAMIAAVSWFAGAEGPNLPATIVANLPWIPIGGGQWLPLGVLVDSLTIAMMVLVTGISTLVHLYSIGYMTGDLRFSRFFAYLGFFSFSMLGIVLSNSILQLFIFWELVGLTSYLLIGFWYEKQGPQLACKKAFVMNRIGDFGLLIGFGILFVQLGGNVFLPAVHGGMFDMLRATLGGQGVDVVNHPPFWLTLAGIGLFMGAMGKSAQFPLHTWLPDAMEGPTPVSSMVHSATMVAAGVYLTARIYPILTPGAHLFIGICGLTTLVIAALMACVMTDIKRVLAYSTLSQLGYMIVGLAAGAWVYALYHLITHAFFKCCLFQCSGSVINAAHHEQDMRNYGGLAKKMPLTALAFGLSALALSGAAIPFTEIGLSGFYSKDGIIAGTWNYAYALGGWNKLFFWGPLVVAYITPFYMARAFALTFLGKPREGHLHDHAHEAPMTMVVPQLVLAILAVFAALLPIQTLLIATLPTVDYVQGGTYEALGAGFHHLHTWLLYGAGWLIPIALGLALYVPGLRLASRIASFPGLNLLHTWLVNKMYFDALYDGFVVGLTKLFATIVAAFDKYLVDGAVRLAGLVTRYSASVAGLADEKIVDGLVNGLGDVTQSVGLALRQTNMTGRLRQYMLLMLASVSVVVAVVLAVMIWQG